MKLTHLLAAALGAASLAACQPPAVTEESADAPATETVAAETASDAAPPQLPCGVLAQRGWTATLSSGGSRTLTVSGEVDMPSPGYSISLARTTDPADGDTTTLALTARAPSGMAAQVVTAHPVRYFGPAAGPYATVRITCDGATLTDIAVTS